jgi:DNA-directed RNA polymerase subunit RPC12/RpoP
MAYQCPRCGEAVERISNSTAAVAGGAVGALLASAFGSFQCKKCGKIAKREFPPDVQQKMTMGSIAIVGIAVALLVGLGVLLVILRK